MSQYLQDTAETFTFQEKDHRGYFLAVPTSDPWAVSQGLTHRVLMGKVERFARFNKTRAYVAVDEAADGSAVIERWMIRRV